MKPEEIRMELMDIMILVLRGKNTSTKIAKALNIPRRTAAYRLRILEEKGYVFKQIIYNSRPYALTEKGNEATKVYTATFLTSPKGSPRTSPIKLRAHKVSWYFDITRKPYELVDLLAKHAFVPHKNRRWTQYMKVDKGYKIVFNPQKVYIYSDEFYVDSPMEYYPIAIEKLERIKQDLETRFPGLVLGKPNKQMVCASNHLAKEQGPLAMHFFQKSLQDGVKHIYHGDRLNIDFSKGVPEEETVDQKTAPADMQALGEFWNDWVKTPIQVRDLHETSRQVQAQAEQVQAQEVRVQAQDLKVEEGFKRMDEKLAEAKDMHVLVHNGIQELTGRVKAQDELLESTAKTLILHGEELRSQGKILATNVEMQGQNNEMLHKVVMNHENFAIAMHEHVVLVKSLQQVAMDTREGLATIARQHNETLKQVLELSKPWYQKLWERVRKDA